MSRPPALKKFQLKKYLPHSNHCSRNGINGVLSNENRHKELCIKAREKAVACFDIETIARQYAELYRDVLGCENGS
ncbi:MAG: hypothetical protein LWX08_14465 [Deltaproteobacteria bacterium]|jgi:hypothetical protein|nr:hypothetical protein [Deltaproteobacteria bacterium]